MLTSERDENSDDYDEYLQKLMEEYHTEVLTSDSDDDEDFEEFMMKQRMRTRLKLKDKWKS